MVHSITILAIGKLRLKDPEFLLFDEYRKRISWNIEVKEIESKYSDNSRRKIDETKRLVDAIPKQSNVFVLDSNGALISSEGLAEKLAFVSSSHVTFIIGGSDGLVQKYLSPSFQKLSFGRITLPHKLARIILIEQLYRSFSIKSSHPYHK